MHVHAIMAEQEEALFVSRRKQPSSTSN